MSIAHTTVRVSENSALRDRAFLGRSGEALAWVGLGSQREEVGVYGSPHALRRLAEELLAAADAADRLDARREAAGAVR